MSSRNTLSTNVKPIHYELSIFDIEFGGAWSYQATVKITVKVQEATSQIVVNSKEIDIKEVVLHTEVGKSKHSVKAEDIDYDKTAERVSFHFSDDVPANERSVLEIHFSGTINTAMAGFSRSKYKSVVMAHQAVSMEDDYCYMLSTQFEACDARRAFPCFDEPAVKATFDFSIEIPEGLTALGNMPVKSTEKSRKSGMQVVAFETTPIMSTYLLAWSVGDFEYIEAHTEREYNGSKIPVRVYTTRGLKEQGQFALENACKVIHMFSEMFRIDFMLPKCDMIAVHEYAGGAMENWGLITYRTTKILFDEKRSDPKYKTLVAYVVAHEITHFWFGNLATMAWWDALFLKESFATWVGWYAIDKLYPSWNVFGQFITEGMQTAFGLDSLRSSHPIEVPVKDASDVDQIFDAISYLKGCSVIRMLAAHLGIDTFLLGVSKYLKKHAYANATTDDLWSALSEASGLDVNSFANTWIRSIGFPVLTVTEEGPDQLTLQQSRYLSTGDVTAQEDQTEWWLPLGLVTDPPSPTSDSSTHTALTTRNTSLRQIDTTPSSFYKFNKNGTAFYRVNYPPARLTTLGAQKHLLSIEDRISLVADAAALAVSGHGTTPAVLALLEHFHDEENALVWAQVLASLKGISSTFADNPTLAEGLRAFTLRLVKPATEKVDWNSPPSGDDDDFRGAQLPPLLIATAGLAGHEPTVREAKARFHRYTITDGGDESAIHPNLRSAIFCIAAQTGSTRELEALKHLHSTTTSPDGKEITLTAMGSVGSPELARSVLDYLFSPAVAPQDINGGASALAANPATRVALWEYIRDEWDTVHGKLGGAALVFDRFLRISLRVHARKEVGEEIGRWWEGRDTRGMEMTVGVVRDTVEGNVRYRERDEAVVEEWLRVHGYLS